ncbi:hypothetical protein [Streptomyces sp.]|uniref:hypothetical protein n=1 Tax=Streptomyces sp. TaxID=1931 RepID=UPI002F3FB5D9
MTVPTTTIPARGADRTTGRRGADGSQVPGRPRGRSAGTGRLVALLLSPILLVLGLVVAYPIVAALHQSLYRSSERLDSQGFVIQGEQPPSAVPPTSSPRPCSPSHGRWPTCGQSSSPTSASPGRCSTA